MIRATGLSSASSASSQHSATSTPSAGAQLVGVPRRADGPDVEALEALLAQYRPRLFFTQSVAHNPTGTDLTPAKAFRILQLAEKYDLRIVENDPLADFKPPSAPRLCSLDQLARTIYVGSFSKSFPAALRVGFIAGASELASDLADVKALVHISSSEYCERAVDAILTDRRRYQRHLARLRERLAAATAQAMRLFDSVGAEIFARNPETLYLWAALPGVEDSALFAEKLLPSKVVMAPGRIFCVDSQAPSRWFRFNVGLVGNPRFAALLRAALARTPLRV
jgi:DNA-binding transcriptional MocR family regulator